MGCRVTLGDICSFDRGASIPRTRMLNSGDLLYIHYGDLYKGFDLRIDVEKPAKPLPFISADEKIKDSQRLNDQDIVYVLTSETVDDLGHAYLFNNPSGKSAVSGTETTIVRVERKDVVLPAYLNYLMSSPRFISELRQYTRGMKVFRVHPSDVARIEVDLPSIDEQRKVVAILDAIYEKQQTNTKLNDYLAEMGTALFNNVAPQSNAPNAALSDIAEITMGQSPSGSSYNEEGSGEVFYQGRAEFGSFFPRRRLFTTEPKRMAQEGDTLMSVRAPVGDLNIANEKCCIGRGLAAIHSDTFQSFTHYLLRGQSRQLDAFNGDGTVFGSINGKALRALPIYLPTEKEINEIETELKSLDAMIRNNDDEIRLLEQLRDTLLPKLMAGEIDVSEINFLQS